MQDPLQFKKKHKQINLKRIFEKIPKNMEITVLWLNLPNKLHNQGELFSKKNYPEQHCETPTYSTLNAT